MFKRLEDIKKAYYTGAKHVCVQYAKINDVSLLKESRTIWQGNAYLLSMMQALKKMTVLLKIQGII